MSTSSILSQKLEKIETERLIALQTSLKPKIASNTLEILSEMYVSQNGKNDSSQEDQEVGIKIFSKN